MNRGSAATCGRPQQVNCAGQVCSPKNSKNSGVNPPSPPSPGEEMFRKLPKLPPTPSYKCFKEYITLNFEFVTNYVKHIFFHFKTYSNLFSYFGQNEIRKVVVETSQLQYTVYFLEVRKIKGCRP